MKSARKNIVNKLELRKVRTALFVLNNFFLKVVYFSNVHAPKSKCELFAITQMKQSCSDVRVFFSFIMIQYVFYCLLMDESLLIFFL